MEKSLYTTEGMEAERFFQKANHHLRGELRKSLGYNKFPAVGIVDSQSVKTTERGSLKGYDGGKKINGHKRHILIDTQGFLLAAYVT